MIELGSTASFCCLTLSAQVDPGRLPARAGVFRNVAEQAIGRAGIAIVQKTVRVGEAEGACRGGVERASLSVFACHACISFVLE
jgi:hypothetical protein